MVFQEELNDLRARKELLLARCDLTRSILDLECTRFSGSMDFLEKPAQWLTRVKPFLPWLAPIAGYVLARNWKQTLKWGGRYVALRAFRRFWRL